MTREEQIKQQADKYIGHSQDIDEDICITNKRNAFIKGAKWADENPNLYNNEKYHTVKVSCLDELSRKAALYDKFLEKACKWLENRHNIEKYLGILTSRTEDLAKAFRQVMEE